MLDISKWMKDCNDEKYLTELSIPGTHDSCTFNYRFNPDGIGVINFIAGDDPSGLVKCQERSLIEQLERGIRCLDIRGRHINNGLTIHHGVAFLNMTFTQVLEECNTFLNTHPTETILMFLKEEHISEGNNRSYEDTYTEIVKSNNWQGRIWENSWIPKLGEVRGKIVLMRRFPGSKGINFSAWKDNEAFTIPESTESNVKYYIQDKYDKQGEKWREIQRFLYDARIGGPKPDRTWINFTSGTRNPSEEKSLGDTITNFFSAQAGEYKDKFQWDARKVASYVNPKLANDMREFTGHTGILMMDFFDTFDCNLAELIIQRNKL